MQPPQRPSPQQPALSSAQEKETTGEREYRFYVFKLGNFLGTYVITGLLAYLLTYSDLKTPLPRSWGTGGERPSFKEAYGKLTDKLANLGPEGRKLGSDWASTLMGVFAFMQGGNLMTYVIGKVQHHKKGIVQYFNRRSGVPGEVEAYEARHQEVPVESGWALLLGRVSAYLTVLGSYLGARKLAGRERFQRWENNCGDLACAIVPGAQAAGGITAYGQPQGRSRTYRFGQIFGLDFFFTIAAVLIMDFGVHHVFGKNKHRAQAQPEPNTLSQSPPIAERPVIVHSTAAAQTRSPTLDSSLGTPPSIRARPWHPHRGKERRESHTAREAAPAATYLEDELRRHEQRGEAALAVAP